jgi:hypothetical protein
MTVLEEPLAPETTVLEAEHAPAATIVLPRVSAQRPLMTLIEPKALRQPPDLPWLLVLIWQPVECSVLSLPLAGC